MTARVPANTAEVVGVGDIENDFGEAVNLGELHAQHMSQIAPNGVSRDLAPLERSLSEARLPTGRL